MWWLFHMLHNSEGDCCCVGNGCCDRSLVIYTAALRGMDRQAAQEPSGPAMFLSTARTDRGVWSTLVGETCRGEGRQQATFRHVQTTQTLITFFSTEYNPNTDMKK